MQVTDAIREITLESGKTHRELAEKMGKAHAYVSAIISKGTDPKTGTMAELANACGYDLVLVNRRSPKKRIVIEPAEK